MTPSWTTVRNVVKGEDGSIVTDGTLHNEHSFMYIGVCDHDGGHIDVPVEFLHEYILLLMDKLICENDSMLTLNSLSFKILRRLGKDGNGSISSGMVTNQGKEKFEEFKINSRTIQFLSRVPEVKGKNSGGVNGQYNYDHVLIVFMTTDENSTTDNGTTFILFSKLLLVLLLYYLSLFTFLIQMISYHQREHPFLFVVLMEKVLLY